MAMRFILVSLVAALIVQVTRRLFFSPPPPPPLPEEERNSQEEQSYELAGRFLASWGISYLLHLVTKEDIHIVPPDRPRFHPSDKPVRLLRLFLFAEAYALAVAAIDYADNHLLDNALVWFTFITILTALTVALFARSNAKLRQYQHRYRQAHAGPTPKSDGA